MASIRSSSPFMRSPSRWMGQPNNYGLQQGMRLSTFLGIKQVLSLSRAQKLNIAGIRFSTPSIDLIQLLTPQPFEQPTPSGLAFSVSRGARASQVRRLLVAGGGGWRWGRLDARPHPCARVICSALPPPGWLGGSRGRGCSPAAAVAWHLWARWLCSWGRLVVLAKGIGVGRLLLVACSFCSGF